MTKHHLFAIICCAGLVSGCEKGPDPSTAPAEATKAAPTSAAATASATPRESPSAAPSASAASPGGEVIELVPKVSFGPIKLGASKGEVDALGILKVHPQFSAMTIPYTVDYDAAGKVKRIQLSLKYAAGDVKVGALTIARTATFEEVKTLLADCKDRPPATGGTTSDCREGAVIVSIGSGSPAEVWLECVP